MVFSLFIDRSAYLRVFWPDSSSVSSIYVSLVKRKSPTKIKILGIIKEQINVDLNQNKFKISPIK